ncbi:unnamed protein product [Echinostoma caproni]|uniref:Uncharacterized protein n=1 Tax=Echinostoma caproni TaxID=27848 RepID=A0A3P8KMC2_9TREM|nr:unnamed protein product [Echinostoma caproni]
MDPKAVIPDTKPSKSSKTKRKRRGNAGKPSVVNAEQPSPVSVTSTNSPPLSIDLSVESTTDMQRVTPDDSEFELVEISGHPTVAAAGSVTESDPDGSLGADWSLAQPIPHTGDMHEFPYLPGTESQFAIVHSSGSDTHLECGQHPHARHLLNSALNDPVDDNSTPVSAPGNSANLTETTTVVAPVKPVVKRSKARKAD